MAAPIDAFVAGQYFTFYAPPNVDTINYPRYVSTTTGGGALDSGVGSVPSWVGMSRTGFTLHTQSTAEVVEGDALGGSVIDLIYRGGNVFLSWDAISFRPGAIVPSWPWAMLGSVGTLGRLGSAVGGTLFMAAAPLTPASGNPTVGQLIINSLTARNAILAENFRMDWLFDTRLRRIPVQMRLLPFVLGSYAVQPTGAFESFTQTSPSLLTRSDGATNASAQVTRTVGRPPAGQGQDNGFGPLPATGAIASNLTTNPSLFSLDTNISTTTTGIQNFNSFPYFAWYVLI